MKTFIPIAFTLISLSHARFGQEQVPIQAISQVKGGQAGEAATIAGAAISDLLGAANACAKLQRGDEILEKLGTGADAVAAAIGMVAAEKNFDNFASKQPTICSDPALPKNAALRGITPKIDPGVTGADVANALSQKSVATPLNADGKSVADLLTEAGFTNFISQDSQGGKKANAGGAQQNTANPSDTGIVTPSNSGNGTVAPPAAPPAAPPVGGNAAACVCPPPPACAAAPPPPPGKGEKDKGKGMNNGNKGMGQGQKDGQKQTSGDAKMKENKDQQKSNKDGMGKDTQNSQNQNMNDGSKMDESKDNSKGMGKDNGMNMNMNMSKDKGNAMDMNMNMGKDKGNAMDMNMNMGKDKGNAMSKQNGNTDQAKQEGGMKKDQQKQNNGHNMGKAGKQMGSNAGNSTATNSNDAKMNNNAGKKNNNNNAGTNKNSDANKNAGTNNNAGNGKQNQNQNQNQGQANNQNANANNGGGAAATGGADFGSCNPTMSFEAGRPGRKATEFTFQSNDPVIAANQQDALNPNIITNRICDELTNICNANAAAKTICKSAQAQILALGTKDATTATAWNNLVGGKAGRKLKIRRAVSFRH